MEKENIASWTLRVNQTDFHVILPYHFIIDRDCRLIQVGSSLAQVPKTLLGSISTVFRKLIPYELLQFGVPLVRLFEIHRPQIPFDFDEILNFINAVFVLQLKSFSEIENGGISRRSKKSHTGFARILIRDITAQILSGAIQVDSI